jgi:fumarate hydratase subunit beta
MIDIKVPIKNQDLTKFKIGDIVTVSGTIITARDQAHKRILEEEPPFSLNGAALFHAGPIISQVNESYNIVAIGPTTSMRMNPYQADVLDKGVKIVIGKGGMDDSVKQALNRNNALYLVATGGCAALYVDKVKEVKNVNWLDLGVPEALWELKVENFGPLVVGMDAHGNSLF